MNKKVPVLGGIIEEVGEELGKFAETAKKQITQIEDKDSKQQTEEVVKHLYGVDKSSANEKTATTEAQKSQETQKLAKLRQELHQKYVQSLETPKPKEETSVERVEKQKMQDLREKDEKEKKKKPIVVQRAQQSVEKFRGAAG